MAKHLEPYIKENNVLQLSLFYFGSGKPKKMCTEWEDDSGKYRLSCDCKFGVPGSFDQDVYTATMRIWVKQGMPEDGIVLNYSDIARELGYLPRDWNTRIKNSLKKLAMARYEFKQCFISMDHESKSKVDTYFSLFDSASLFSYEKKGVSSKKKSKSKLIFPKEIRQNLEAKYYQYLDMAWYRSFPPGITRRLYEYLEKRRYHNINGSFTIAEEAICRWLPITDSNAARRRNKLQKNTQELIERGYLSAYEFDKKKKQCIFTYAKNTAPQQGVIKVASEEKQVIEKQKAIPVPTAIQASSITLISLIKLKRIPKALREIIDENITAKGSEYVKRNILYANQNAKRNYSTYLQKALANDWGKVWAEEQEVKREAIEQEQQFDVAEAIRLDEERRAKEEKAREERKKELEKQAAEFIEKVKTLGPIMRDAMRQKAASETPRGCPPQLTRIKFATLLLEAVNQMGNNFSNDVLTPDFIRVLWEIE